MLEKFLRPLLDSHINSAEIVPEQMANVRNIADHVKDNTIKKLVVTGYADAKTGTPEYNQKLSEKREQKLLKKRALINFGVPEDRLIVGAEGDKVQQYEDNDLESSYNYSLSKLNSNHLKGISKLIRNFLLNG